MKQSSEACSGNLREHSRSFIFVSFLFILPRVFSDLRLLSALPRPFWVVYFLYLEDFDVTGSPLGRAFESDLVPSHFTSAGKQHSFCWCTGHHWSVTWIMCVIPPPPAVCAEVCKVISVQEHRRLLDAAWFNSLVLVRIWDEISLIHVNWILSENQGFAEKNISGAAFLPLKELASRNFCKIKTARTMEAGTKWALQTDSVSGHL